MQVKDFAMIGGAAIAVYLLLRVIAPASKQTQKYWAVEQGNTGYPPIMKTGGGVWV